MNSCSVQVNQLRDAIGKNTELEVIILLDALRGCRKSEEGSSLSILTQLSEKFPGRIRFFLYHTPELSGWLKRVLPHRINEVCGVQHLKAYIFDDKTILSGANLQDQYYTDRQDRYIVFSSNPQLASFYVKLIQKICQISFFFNSDTGEVDFPLDILPRPDQNPVGYKEEARKILIEWLKEEKDICLQSGDLYQEFIFNPDRYPILNPTTILIPISTNPKLN
eukprot:TRINITY_DN3384_c0_g1_i2.p1 TRINITY_DN3384_c0_g1~~TRINITY_DN3384_c0_g1_i2.p1  ORF type:complete len:222 (-),score=39.64 TRINITY_DN3384_c0_g1_i2:231-896(-)